MTDQQTTPSDVHNIAQAIQEVSERGQLLVREEIELAKAEVTAKVSRLLKGAVVGIAAGIFAVFGLVFLLHGLAWLAWFELFGSTNQYFWGFLVVAGVLFLLGALAGFVAAKALKAGSPPTPAMAIDEAKRIRETVSSPHPEQTV
ncbi:MAG: hypothetical protein QOJ82_4116 [Solirubrobacteraceae bacterium]|jgi:uncharacterized membrane protein YqjE|nr:hypothetical protein [Solirubrobacteraceae bacterium]